MIPKMCKKINEVNQRNEACHSEWQPQTWSPRSRRSSDGLPALGRPSPAGSRAVGTRAEAAAGSAHGPPAARHKVEQQPLLWAQLFANGNEEQQMEDQRERPSTPGSKVEV